eukprot:1388034-Amorphochlora_amoeboformis.AAC.3
MSPFHQTNKPTRPKYTGETSRSGEGVFRVVMGWPDKPTNSGKIWEPRKSLGNLWRGLLVDYRVVWEFSGIPRDSLQRSFEGLRCTSLRLAHKQAPAVNDPVFWRKSWVE